MDKFERKEYKYFVPSECLDSMRERFLTNMKYDPFCAKRGNKPYHVRSIYLDTRQKLFYFEKLDGLKVRKKLRVRTYNSPEETDIAFLEIKRRVNDTVFKERAMIPLEETPLIMNGANLHIVGKKSFVAKTAMNRFIYLTKRLSLEPKVLITYEREAFHGIDNPDVRVTFDMNVRSYYDPKMEDLFREKDLRVFTDPNFILEIKFNTTMPLWARKVVHDYRLRLQSISKFCTGIDAWYERSNVSQEKL